MKAVASILLLLALSLTSCARNAYWWDKHPDQFKVSAAYQTAEPIFDRVRGSNDPIKALRFPIVMQNDSREGMQFATYDGQTNRWTGQGVVAEVVVSDNPKLRVLEIDYSALSGRIVTPGGESGSGHAIWVTIEPDATMMVARQVHSVKMEIEVRWGVHGADGEVLGVTRRARFFPEVICIGEIGPRKASMPGE